MIRHASTHLCGGGIGRFRPDGRVYAAAYEPDRWRDYLVAARDAFGATSANLILLDQARTEARVADLIAEGRGLQDTADALGVSRHTVQAHLKAVYAKTGVHNHVQLVRLIGSLAVLSRREI